ncbi:hypothetical protein FCV43_19895 [Vibrio genomosp. F6]|uniref:hypothetical protein n=1 Tax=Vibrio genomosp. F6 TaxID=723172 RepID=UPI0010BDBE21|nr:hypothetical protein [Vibrio genomosp. F6]TKF13740.1 hypothetical protein FCV43_19895 [Vibrio genomosp. F6]
MSKTIFFLVKIFDNKKYAQDFVDGKLFANRLAYFRRLEEQEEANRGDKHEAVVSWIQPEQANLVINGKPITGLAGPVSVQMNWHDYLNVFCMYAAHSGSFNYVSHDNLVEFRKQLEIPDDCLKLGKYAVVVTNFTKFVERVHNAAVVNNYGMSDGLVDYYDPNEFSGSFLELEAIFKKRSEFSHQKEYRFAFDTGVSDKTPLVLDVGNLSDIVTLCDVEKLNQVLEIRLSEKAG